MLEKFAQVGVLVVDVVAPGAGIVDERRPVDVRPVVGGDEESVAGSGSRARHEAVVHLEAVDELGATFRRVEAPQVDEAVLRSRNEATLDGQQTHDPADVGGRLAKAIHLGQRVDANGARTASGYQNCNQTHTINFLKLVVHRFFYCFFFKLHKCANYRC